MVLDGAALSGFPASFLCFFCRPVHHQQATLTFTDTYLQVNANFVLIVLILRRAACSRLLSTTRLSPSLSQKRDWMEKREPSPYRFPLSRLRGVIWQKAAGSARQASSDEHSTCRSLSAEVWSGTGELLNWFSGAHLGKKRHQQTSQTKQTWFLLSWVVAGRLHQIGRSTYCTFTVVVRTVGGVLLVRWVMGAASGQWTSGGDTGRDINAQAPALILMLGRAHVCFSAVVI